ncbi:MAG: DNA polymerase III subunit gamma/tau [Chloroflexota bacterium]|nr:DNA polymerase III subunit gamma/tau [Chloroflexota bacterium]
MSSEVFYRKWRPQTLAEVVGQEVITETLRRAVKNGKIAHAYLFCGPRGTGKTSTGRILAKAINCPNQVDGEPCNDCDICRSITEGISLDVIEMDAASNRGIDEIRNLRERANYAPSLAKYKVYIIDEVHMLTEWACNALLKTMEEPPPHVIFVLATTEAHKMMPTIVSRCQRFNFHRLSQGAIADKLRMICEKEGIDIDTSSLELIARTATGSLRDAENILQQLIAYHGSQIVFKQVQAALGSSNDSRVRQLAQCVVNRDLPTGLQAINGLNSDGVDLRQFNLGLMEYLRDLLLIKSGCEGTLDITAEDRAEMKRLMANVTLDYLLRATRLFSSIEFRTDSYSSLPLELALVECVLSPSRGKQAPITNVVETTGRVEMIHESIQSIKETESPAVTDKAVIASDVSVGKEELEEVKDSQDFNYLHGRWKDFIYSLRGEGSSGNLDALLRSACEPLTLKDGILVLGFYHSFHMEKIEDAKYRHLIERKLKEVFGQSYKIECILVDRKKTTPQKKMQNPLIQAAIDMGARIAD